MKNVDWQTLMENTRLVLTWPPFALIGEPQICKVDWQLLLEYLKVVLAWPPLALIGGVLFVWRFQNQIAFVIQNMKTLKVGNLEGTIGATQQAAAPAVADAFKSLPGEAAEDVANAPLADDHAVKGPQQVPPAQGAAADPAQAAAAANAPPIHHHAVLAQPHVAPAQGDAANAAQAGEGINWAISDDAVRLALPMPDGHTLQTVAEWVRLNPGPTVSDYVVINAALRSERCFHLIFGTQVDALLFLKVAPGPRMLVELLPFHSRHVAIMNAPQPVAIDVYLVFLLKQGLIENVGPADGPMYRLTNFGHYFLHYIQQFYPLIWNKRAF